MWVMEKRHLSKDIGAFSDGERVCLSLQVRRALFGENIQRGPVARWWDNLLPRKKREPLST